MTKTDAKRQSSTRKPMKISERLQYTDPITGEKVEQHIFKIEERDANFHKLWLYHIAAALELIGNQKILILSYILANTRKDNLFISRQADIAKAVGTAIQTVSTTIKLLKEANILKIQQPGVYLINPDVIYKGSGNDRLEILYQYYSDTKKRKKGN
jgi:hypothetical protein